MNKKTKKATAPGKGRPQRPLVIDFHAHILNPKVFEITRKHSLHTRIGLAGRTSLGDPGRSSMATDRMTNLAGRLADLDAMKIDIQVISPSLIHQNTASMKGEAALKLVREVNDDVAEAVARHPDRLVGLGIVPFQEPKLATGELERMVARLGLRGVEIPSFINGHELGDKMFRPFWRKAEKLDVPVFIHPAGNADERLRRFGLAFSVGQPYEEALAMSSLIYEGVMDRFPRLKILISHGGGYLPYYAGRQDNAQLTGADGVKLKGSFSSYIRRFYYETVIFNPDMLDFLATKTPASHIVMGTDYPFGEHHPIRFVRRAKSLTRATQDGILGRHAARILKLRI